MNVIESPIARPLPSAVAPKPRVDLYAPIHKALRHAMCDTLGRVGRVDVFDATDLADTLQRLDALLTLCTGHIAHENDFVHTAIEARQHGGSQRIAGEHVEHLHSIEALRGEAASLSAADPACRQALALRLYRHLALFVAENFQHMHIEETAQNAALWAHYSDAELLDLHQRLSASLEPHEQLEVARWMVPALNPAERASVVSAMQAEAAPQAFAGLLEMIRPLLRQADWLKLKRDIGV